MSEEGLCGVEFPRTEEAKALGRPYRCTLRAGHDGEHTLSYELPRNVTEGTVDVRKVSYEKLSAARSLANDMMRASATEPNGEAMKKLAIFGERLHKILDGDF